MWKGLILIGWMNIMIRSIPWSVMIKIELFMKRVWLEHLPYIRGLFGGNCRERKRTLQSPLIQKSLLLLVLEVTSIQVRTWERSSTWNADLMNSTILWHFSTMFLDSI
jgi:hypothetical protein